MRTMKRNEYIDYLKGKPLMSTIISGKKVYFHEMIMNAGESQGVIFKDGNSKNCLTSNLELVNLI